MKSLVSSTNDGRKPAWAYPVGGTGLFSLWLSIGRYLEFVNIVYISCSNKEVWRRANAKITRLVVSGGALSDTKAALILGPCVWPHSVGSGGSPSGSSCIKHCIDQSTYCIRLSSMNLAFDGDLWQYVLWRPLTQTALRISRKTNTAHSIHDSWKPFLMNTFEFKSKFKRIH